MATKAKQLTIKALERKGESETAALTAAVQRHLNAASASLWSAWALIHKNESSAGGLKVLCPRLMDLAEAVGNAATVVRYYGVGFAQMVREIHAKRLANGKKK